MKDIEIVDQLDIEGIFNKFADCVAKIAVLLAEHPVPIVSLKFDPSIQFESEFLSSMFKSSKENFDLIDKQVDVAKECISELKRWVHRGESIPILLYRRCVRELNDATGIVQRVNKQSFTRQLNGSTDEVVKDHKEVERVIVAYRSLILEFNGVAIEYNRVNCGIQLSPLASCDVSPS